MSGSVTLELSSDDLALGQGGPDGRDIVQEQAAPQAQEPTQEPVAEQTAEDDSKKPLSWEQRRINKMTRDLREAERRAALAERTAEQAIAALKTAAGEPDKITPPTITPELFQSEVEKAAAAKQFDATCNAIYQQGVSELPGFEGRLRNFAQVGGLNPVLIEAALESGNAHKILFDLGGDLDEAARILELPPVRMAAAVARFAALQRGETKKVSSAPAPIKPITPAASSVEDPEKMNNVEWRAWREKELEKKKRR